MPPELKQTLRKAECLVRPLGFIHRHEFQAVKEEKGSEEQRGNDVKRFNKIQQAIHSGKFSQTASVAVAIEIS